MSALIPGNTAEPFYYDRREIGTIAKNPGAPTRQQWVATSKLDGSVTVHSARSNARFSLVRRYLRVRSLGEMVERAWNIATIENGYTFAGQTPEQIAIDMADCDSDIGAHRTQFDDVDDAGYVAAIAEFVKRHLAERERG